MKKIDVEIQSVASLLQCRHPTPKEQVLITGLNTKGKKRELTTKELFNMHAYKTKAGKFYQPSEMIEASMVKGATQFGVKGQGKKTYKDYIKAGVVIEPVEIIHKVQKCAIDERWGTNEHTGGAVWVVRPRFDKWALSFRINLLQDERVSTETLYDILEYAGMYVGIGAWRPKFGRFKITKWTVK